MYVLRTRAFLIRRQLREQYRLLIKRLPRAIKSLLLCAPSRIYTNVYISIQVCSISLEICFEILWRVLTITGGSPITLLGLKQCQLTAHVDNFCSCLCPGLLSLLWLALPADGSPLDLDNWLHLCCTHSHSPQRLYSWVIQLTAQSRSCLKYLHNADNTGGASRKGFVCSLLVALEGRW